MIWAALSIGLLGGIHCTFMCAPLMLGVFRNQSMAWGFAAYQTGRIITYIILGLALAFVGESLSILGWQNSLSIMMAIFIVYFYVLPARYRFLKFINKIESVPYQGIKDGFKKFIGKQDILSRFSIGLLNGLLPCGLVYLALLSSFATETIMDSVVFMAVFGLGTLPWLIASVWAGKLTFRKLNGLTQKLRPALALTLAIFLFLRGLEVQFIHIPLPDLGQTQTTMDIPICGER